MALEIGNNVVYIGTAKPESGGQTINNEDMNITENGEYSASEGYTGIGTATVNVPSFDTITATNKTGLAITSGDKVWVLKNGSEYSLISAYSLLKSFLPIGDISINNLNIASSFSTSNYIMLHKPFNPSSNTWEFPCKITTSNDVTSNQKLLHSCVGISGGGRFGIGVIINSGKFGFFSTSNGTGWLFDVSGTHNVQANTTYWLKAGWDGSKYYLDYSMDGETYTRDIEETNSTATYGSLIYTYIGIMSNNTMQNPFLGTIDLSETKIVVNDEDWWLPTYGVENTLTGYALANIADNATGNVKTIL